MRPLLPFVVAVLLGCMLSTAQAKASTARFDAANAQFYEGEYAQAAEAFEAIITSDEGRDAAVFYNLGNARFRQGQYGQAIWAYRSGLNAHPQQSLGESLSRNLQVAREALQDRYRTSGDGSQFIFAEPTTLAYRVTHALSLRTLTVIMLLLWWLLIGLLVARRMAPGRLPWGTLALSVGLLTVISSSLVAGNLMTAYDFETGVIVSDDVRLREGPDERARGIEVPEGMEVRVLGSVESWERVELVSGRVGWVSAESLRRL